MTDTRTDLPLKTNSDWDRDQLLDFIDRNRWPLRLSLMSGPAPLIVPLWFYLEDGGFWCASQAGARLTQLVGDTAMPCGLDFSDNEMPYRGVRGQGVIEVLPNEGERVLNRLVSRYLGNEPSDFSTWLLSRADREVAFRITPSWLTTWDFSERMS